MKGNPFTDFYRFDRLDGQKSKTRVDCEVCTNSYQPLEALRGKDGGLHVYITKNYYTQDGTNFKSDLALNCGRHISSLYQPDPSKAMLFGDVMGTNDALIIQADELEINQDGVITEGGFIEVYVARGMKRDKYALWLAAVNGELDSGMEAMRLAAARSTCDK